MDSQRRTFRPVVSLAPDVATLSIEQLILVLGQSRHQTDVVDRIKRTRAHHLSYMYGISL